MAMEQGAVVPVERKPRGVNWLYVTPMLAAPILPLSRLALRNHPRARAWVFGGLIAAFLTHGAWLITRSNAH